jgi:hypothetical protein
LFAPPTFFLFCPLSSYSGCSGVCFPVALQIRRFWRIVTNFSDEERGKLLQFVTGSARVPAQGFAALQVR